MVPNPKTPMCHEPRKLHVSITDAGGYWTCWKWMQTVPDRASICWRVRGISLLQTLTRSDDHVTWTSYTITVVCFLTQLFNQMVPRWLHVMRSVLPDRRWSCDCWLTGPKNTATMARIPTITDRMSLVLWKRRNMRTTEAFSMPFCTTSSSQSLCSLLKTTRRMIRSKSHTLPTYHKPFKNQKAFQTHSL